MVTSLQPYKTIIHNPFYYSFVTTSGVEYFCYFTPYKEYFPNYPTEVASKFYAFNLDLADKKAKQKGVDKRIADTVITIVGDFLNKKINAVVYICDPSDGKAKARFRKFKSWFDYYEHPSYQIIQITSDFEAGGMKLYTALLIHRKNKLKKELVEAYLNLTD
ncbi:MAG: hypothetical protein K2X48_06115 [Chitinophagaceae bacterium]|nr:hypothetical protein [Chitinophagaceae bacterium]